MLPLSKSRSRSGSMEGSAGYASFKKELQVICHVTRVELPCGARDAGSCRRSMV
jgi:hypothetical protein